MNNDNKISFGDRLAHAWNAFKGPSTNANQYVFNPQETVSYSPHPYRPYFAFVNGKDMVSAIYNQLSVDVSSIKIKHVKINEDGAFYDTVDDGLNQCLTVSANIDQTGRSFIQDACLTMFDEGVIAIVPVDTTLNPDKSSSYDILSMRVGKIREWWPSSVRVELYNDRTGRREEVYCKKNNVAIVENPLYNVMNEPNGTLKRLVNKLSLLDALDRNNASGKMDLIIQLPYVIKSEQRRAEAEKRRKDIEFQLTSSKYGIAYTDGTERITQLNRPVENNLLEQVNGLTDQLFSQLGLSKNIFEGAASELEMLHYYNRTIEPIVSAIVDSMHRTFLTKTARTQGHAIRFFRDPFRSMQMSQVAQVANQFITNRVMDANEVRSVLGYRPHSDPSAAHLTNPNIDANKDMPLNSEENNV